MDENEPLRWTRMLVGALLALAAPGCVSNAEVIEGDRVRELAGAHGTGAVAIVPAHMRYDSLAELRVYAGDGEPIGMTGPFETRVVDGTLVMRGADGVVHRVELSRIRRLELDHTGGPATPEMLDSLTVVGMVIGAAGTR